MASAGSMVLRCSKTNRIFFSAEEANDHAEAFGKDYANFEEISADTKMWICTETKKPCFSEEEVEKTKQRDPSSKTFEQKTVQFLIDEKKAKDAVIRRKEAFFDSVDQKKLQALVEVKKHGRVRAAKALHFTKDAGTLAAAESWLSENADALDIDVLTDEFLDTQGVIHGGDDFSVVEEEGPDDRKVGDPNPEEIKAAVNKDMLQQLIEMEFSELRAEKALYKTDNAGIEHAVNWLTEHLEDPDIDLPLKKPAPPAPAKPKMSKEEAEAKALELQARLREKRAQEEKISEKDKERMRIESTKMMVEANEKLKEEERKRSIQQMKMEKDASEKERAILKEKIRQDYIERFGREPPTPEETQEESVKEKSGKDQVIFYINKLKKTYKDTNSEGLKTCLSTIKIYAKNLQDYPQDPKYKKLKLDGKAFQTRVAPYDGAIDLLGALGFDAKDDVLEQRRSIPDGWLCGQAIKFIDIVLGQL